MKKSLKCASEDIEALLNCAFEAIIMARQGLVDKDEALDAIWEYLVNVEYEVRRLKYRPHH